MPVHSRGLFSAGRHSTVGGARAVALLRALAPTPRLLAYTEVEVHSREYNFDGLVGPTHHYAGLSHGNVASLRHAGQPGNPRAAALEGLRKMRFVSALGVGQAVLPPQPRPDVRMLRRLGFGGTNEEVLSRALEVAPRLLGQGSSAS